MLLFVALLISLYAISPDFSIKKPEISKNGMCPFDRAQGRFYPAIFVIFFSFEMVGNKTDF
jgi:hypothetical protein